VKSPREETKPLRNEGRPARQKSLYDSLEQEMASLSGRSGSKTRSSILRCVDPHARLEMLDLQRLGVKLGIAHRDQTIAFREQRLLLRDELGATYSQPETGEAREPKALSRNFPVGGGWKLQRSAPHGRLHKVPPC
jgi:hypothetical protein